MGLFDKIRRSAGGEDLSPADALMDELLKANKKSQWEAELKDCERGKVLLKSPREAQKAMVMALVDRLRNREPGDYNSREWKDWHLTLNSIVALLRRKLPFEDGDLCQLIRWVSARIGTISPYWLPLAGAAAALERFAKESDPSEELASAGRALADPLLRGSYGAEFRKYGKKIVDALGAGEGLVLVAGDVWADAAAQDLESLGADPKKAWGALLSFCQRADGGKPTKAWLKEADGMMGKVDEVQFREWVVKWLGLVDKPAEEERAEGNVRHSWNLHPLQLRDPNQDVLKGLAWCCSLRPDLETTRALGALCQSAFKKIPGRGPRAARLGNACIYSLGALEGEEPLAQLALLKVKIKNRSVQKQIAKALAAAAEREGVTPEDLEEMSVPGYGLTDVGLLEEEMGDFTARLTVEGTSSTKLEWVKADGKVQKSVPASVKADFAEGLNELRATAKDIQKMLPAVRERIDNLFLARKSWPYPVWKERYFDHPLTGSLARRLIWTFGEEGAGTSAIFHEGKFVDAHGNTVQEPADLETEVRLWHPLDVEPEAALSWRNWLEEYLVQQPFKQAHREIYLLTDAERNTGTYSNRFAAHIIRQHQFNALCQARGWRNTLRLMVDDDYPPASRELPNWGIRAEFWIEGIGDNYGVDTNDSGTFLYLATDQVRFYPIDSAQYVAHASGGGYSRGWRGAESEPMKIEEVPKLVFSEIMRDVDLFVGVASVGNDPNWSDGGPEGRHLDYWTSYSFGELSATAKTRKGILERLLPRLKIAEKARIDGKFLVVEGEIRTYKIHLGSGNILMEPNDQYLCIVPNAAARRGTDKLFLPFEGDNVMAIILSKAFLLAEDKKIKDSTIVSQIRG